MSIIQIKDGIVTPAQITADKNNYAPTGLSGANIMRLSTDASRTITGLEALRRSRLLIICNVGSFDIVLADSSGSSTAGNRFALSSDMTLNPDESVTLWYDLATSRWRALTQPQIAGAGTGTVTTASVVTANGISGSVANATTTPAITLTRREIWGEPPTGAIDGANATFTLANAALVGFVGVYLNGIRQKLTTHYTIAGAVITMGSAPLGGDILQVDYIY